MQPVNTRVPELDLLRFAGVLAIVFFHYAFRGHAADAKSLMPYPLLEPMAKYGYLALELVFMISGFVISMSAANRTLRDFVVSRIVRLYPAFWVCCTLTFLVTLAIGAPRYSATLGQFLINLTMLAEFAGVPSLDGVYWFLYVQLLLYALMAAAMAVGGMRRLEWLLGAWLAGEAAVEFLPIAQHPAHVLADYSVCFAAGAVFFLIWSRGITSARFAMIIAALVLAIRQAFTRLPGFERHYDTTMSLVVVGGVIVLSFAAMLFVALRRPAASRLDRWSRVGAISYPLFLVHEYSGYMIFNTFYPAVSAHVLLWGTIALAIGAAYVIHVFIERRMAAALHATLTRLAAYQDLQIVAAATMVLPVSILALGTYVPGIPYLTSLGTWIFTALAGPLAMVAIVGAAIALAATRRQAGAGVAIAIAGGLTAIASGTVVARHAGVAATNGVTVNLFATVLPHLGGAGVAGAPSATNVYDVVDGKELRLDLYRPVSRGQTLAPVVVHVHGGGWISGSRSVKAANLRWLADRGFLAVSLDYELATPDHPTWNIAGPQVACALSWIAANATKYGGDPERLLLFGESAGGTLALTVAYAAAAGEAESSCGGHVPVVRAVAALMPAVDLVSFDQNQDPIQQARARRMVTSYLGGSPFEYPDRLKAVSPWTYLSKNAPPTFILLSDDDRLVPVEGALRFIDSATQAGVPVRTIRFPLADHGAAALFYSVVNQTFLQVVHGLCDGRCAAGS